MRSRSIGPSSESSSNRHRTGRRSDRRTPSRGWASCSCSHDENTSSNRPIGLRVGQDRERRIDARLDRPLAQEIGAEGVDGADVRFFEVMHGVVEERARGGVRRRLRARSLELFAQAQLQLAGGLFAERDRDDLADRGALVLDQRDDAADELGRLAGAGGGFDDERLVELRRDQLAILGPRRPPFEVGAVTACSSTRRDRRRASRPFGASVSLPGCRTRPGSHTNRRSWPPVAPRARRSRSRDR